jgi:hypothetical protein
MYDSFGYGINVNGSRRLSLEECLKSCKQIISLKRLKEFISSANFDIPMHVSLADFFMIISMCYDTPSFEVCPVIFCGRPISSLLEAAHILDAQYDLEMGDSKYETAHSTFMSKFHLNVQASIKKLIKEEESRDKEEENEGSSRHRIDSGDDIKMPSLARKV